MTIAVHLTDVSDVVSFMIMDTDYEYEKDWKWGNALCIDSGILIEMILGLDVTEETICMLKLKFNI